MSTLCHDGSLLMDGHYMLVTTFACECCINGVLGLSYLVDQVEPLLWHSCQTICLVMFRTHGGYVHPQSILFKQACKHTKSLSDEHFTHCHDVCPSFSYESIHDLFVSRVDKEV